MSNIFDYLLWRDISMDLLPFNEIDNLILARFSYFPLDGFIKNEEKVTIHELYERYVNGKMRGRILQPEDPNLFKALAKSTRFSNFLVTRYINKFVPEEEKQFAAVTILFSNSNTMYVSYRGTDSTIVGWKEDFNMSFSDVVPAQKEAVAYLNSIAKEFKKRDIIVGGHSKGGNLAVYSSTFCDEKVQNRIIAIYNNDGPGFHNSVINCDNYNKILNRIVTYIPQTSIIGRLLEHKEKTIILKSTQTGIMQHNLYSWQVLADKFIKDELTYSSEVIDKTITNWLKEISPDQREVFINTLFEILSATNASTLPQISDKWFSSAKTMLKTYKNLDSKSKEIMIEALNALLKIGKSSMKKKKYEPKGLVKTNNTLNKYTNMNINVIMNKEQ